MQARAEVIWLIDKRLYSREGTTRTLSNVRVLDKIIDPSPVIREVLVVAMEITDWGEGRTFFKCLEFLIMWLDAPVSII